MNDALYEELFQLHLIFGIIHLIYFLIYYGRYSTLNQKLNHVLKIEKAGAADQMIIETSKASISGRINKWRKWSYIPVPLIASIHLVFLVKTLPENPQAAYLLHNKIFFREIFIDHSLQYWIVGFILLGSTGLIAMGNYTKGAQIFDPNKSYRGTGRPW